MMFFRRFGGGLEMKGGGGSAALVGDYVENQQQQQQEGKGGLLVDKQPLPEHHHHAQQQQQKPDCYSDEVDSGSGDAAAAADPEQRHPKKQKRSAPASAANVPSGGDGTTVEVMRRPRGRPPGSKNKPKPPVVITRDADDLSSPAAMRPYILEVPSGEDVVDALARFTRRRSLGLSVLSGTGLVSNVVLRHASTSATSPSTNLTFHGHFEILSMSATFFPPSFAPSPPSTLPAGGGCGGFSISLAGPQGRVFGGLVVAPLIAAGTVTILAAAFCNPTYHRLPTEDDVSFSVSVSVSGGGAGGDVEAARVHVPLAQHHQRQQHNASSQQQQQQQDSQEQQQHQHYHHQQQQQQQQQRSTSPPSSSSAAAVAAPAAQRHQQHQRHHTATAVALPAAAEACGLSIYNCHLPSDVIWAPTARSPPY